MAFSTPAGHQQHAWPREGRHRPWPDVEKDEPAHRAVAGELNRTPARREDDIEIVAAARVRSSEEAETLRRELAQKRIVNEVLKTKLTETREQLESLQTRLFKTEAKERPTAPHLDASLASAQYLSWSYSVQLGYARQRIYFLEGEAAALQSSLCEEKAAKEDAQADLTCFACFELVPREQRMLTLCCRRFSACSSCYGDWLDASLERTCPFCRERAGA